MSVTSLSRYISLSSLLLIVWYGWSDPFNKVVASEPDVLEIATKHDDAYKLHAKNR